MSDESSVHERDAAMDSSSNDLATMWSKHFKALLDRKRVKAEVWYLLDKRCVLVSSEQ
jgi:hypothetical protein